ncbi:hypothetical protein HMPREF3237_03455 [Streptococcus sp. HMSC34B10]|uniref:DUF1307 domain-containing protein n=1 Tax=Streptococcus sp. HMSC34B10 TaxID=1608856 RepID=UPI0008A92D13|nr:DUF1307 domain-containing protein [Streptococcus sp. HMSC34B10]OHS87663.1 hypothetical protein HMPREF3237_03455 [Streptococcus sp. HMSC34B10]
MNKHLKISVALLSSIFVLVACGQNNSASSATETTQAAEATTTAPTSNKQNTTEDLPKDGVQRFKHVDKGGSTFLIYYFKDDIVYKQIGIYFYNPKGLGKSEEEVIQLLNKSQELYKDVTGIISKVEKEDGEYIQTVIYNYQTMDWKELHRRDPNQFPETKPKPVKFSEAAAKLQEKGYVKYE